ncbi:MAG: hypothetical protein LBD53_11030, partial [Tannerella sp.]|nr:hypothetical protein [Tannerella sp.]
MTDVSSKPLAGFKTTARVRGTVIPFRLIVSFLLAMTDVSSKPLAGFKTTARVLGTVITYCLGLSFLLPMTKALSVVGNVHDTIPKTCKPKFQRTLVIDVKSSLFAFSY